MPGQQGVLGQGQQVQGVLELEQGLGPALVLGQGQGKMGTALSNPQAKVSACRLTRLAHAAHKLQDCQETHLRYNMGDELGMNLKAA